MSFLARKKKLLLMGKSGAGKTSMKSIIFSNYIARDTSRLSATIDIEQSYVRFMTNLTLFLWDCGGEEHLMNDYLSSQRKSLFESTHILIYVFDIESGDFSGDLRLYQAFLEALLSKSPTAQIFCLVNKMDHIEKCNRTATLIEKEHEILRFSSKCTGYNEKNKPKIFCTSIWDESLYRAWAAIVHSLVPNIHIMEEKLQQMAINLEADEVLLLEKTTFLVISRVQLANVQDFHEKVSCILKQFKVNLARISSRFKEIYVRNKNVCVLITLFTPNTYIMVALPDASVEPGLTLLNIKRARKAFERYESG